MGTVLYGDVICLLTLDGANCVASSAVNQVCTNGVVALLLSNVSVTQCVRAKEALGMFKRCLCYLGQNGGTWVVLAYEDR